MNAGLCPEQRDCNVGEGIGDIEVHDVVQPTKAHLERFYEKLANQSVASQSTSDRRRLLVLKRTSDHHQGSGSYLSPQQARRHLLSQMDDRGYRLDRYKNIPGWGLMADLCPDAKWYISIDDDTYWFHENFRAVVDQYDPDVPLYTGNSMCCGFGNSSNGRTGASFLGGLMPHGGEGMIMSRGAMSLLKTVLQSCIEQVVDAAYMYGDVQSTICMRDFAKVPFNNTIFPGPSLLDDPPMWPPWLEADEARKTFYCTPVVAVHHIEPFQLQALWRVESAAPGRRPTYEHVVKGLLLAGQDDRKATAHVADLRLEFFLFNNTNTAVSVLRYLDVSTSEACLKACEADAECQTFTYVPEGNQTCHLKRDIGALQDSKPEQGFLTGGRARLFQCSS